MAGWSSPSAGPGGFNPHRPFRAGATWSKSSPKRGPRGYRFNPHRPFRAGATFFRTLSPMISRSFNPHRPFRAGATSTRLGYSPAEVTVVSILTGPFGPVQPSGTPGSMSSTPPASFNPHRPFRAGATGGRQPPRPLLVLFQSSPALSGRCNPRFSSGTFPPSLPAFQSSPALSGRCNMVRLRKAGRWKVFQSSPALSGRCNSSR